MLPTQGKEGTSQIEVVWHTGNDLEILAICFRLEVEQFLKELSVNFDYGKGYPVGLALVKEEEERVQFNDVEEEEEEPQTRFQSVSTAVRKHRTRLYTSHIPDSFTATHSFWEPCNNTRISEAFGTAQQRFRRERPLHFRTTLPDQSHRLSRGGNPGDDPDDSDESDDQDHCSPHNNGAPHQSQRGQGPNRSNPNSQNSRAPLRPQEGKFHFDLKLKMENIPKWDGDTDNIVTWMPQITDLAKDSPTIYKQLGQLVPKHLEGSALKWFWALPEAYRTEIQDNWGTLQGAMAAYYMNCHWLDKMKAKANHASYRDSGNQQETPSEYFIWKNFLLTQVSELTDSEIIMEVMDRAPANWTTILTTQAYADVVEFQAAIRYHEDSLLSLESSRPYFGYRHSD
ncbi:hypothetical protein C8J56DRAFT_1049146 [Mycena floridula]|nr:hypothetical protein C8J56DRAFT_1049146 [Mycena floridula]